VNVGNKQRKGVGDMVPNGSFFPPISLVAPASAERFNQLLRASPIDLKESSSFLGPREGDMFETRPFISASVQQELPIFSQAG
jgi:hypothetical protein